MRTIHYDHKHLVQLKYYALVYYFSLSGGVMEGTSDMWCCASSTAMQYFVI